MFMQLNRIILQTKELIPQKSNFQAGVNEDVNYTNLEEEEKQEGSMSMPRSQEKITYHTNQGS